MTVGAAQGRYPGEPASRSYQVSLVDLSMPRRVMVGNRALPMVPAGSHAAGWHYDTATATAVIQTPRLPVNQPATISQDGGRPVTRPEPAAVALSLDPATPLSIPPGSSTA